MANWLDKYEQGGMVLKQKTHDNYGKKPNVNNIESSVGPGFVGLAYDTTGRNYSPAWGGQFQNGGNLWNTDKKAFVDSTLNANKNLDFVHRLYDPSAGSIQIPGEHGRSTHYMANDKTRVYPEVVNIHGKLQYLPGDKGYDYADSTGEYINFKTPEQAEWFASSRDNTSGYKMGTNVLSKIDPKTGKPKMQMGGSMPGAVGFTYARVAGSAPANGKYTKKTKASAKNGSIIKDDLGQWAHPGKITQINSNDITMQGVDYPVLGVSDTGHTQMMQPGQDYKFDGKKVTEYPMMQEGGWLDKSSLILNDQVPSTASVQKKTIDDITTKQQIALQKKIDNQGSIEKAGPNQSSASKTWSILTNPMTALSYKVHGKDLPDHFERGPRNVLDYAVDMVNPYGVVDAAANVPGNLAKGDFGAAALNALAALPALHETGAIAKATKTASELSKAKNLKEVAGYLTKGIPVERSLPRLAEGELKTFRQIQEIPKMAEANKSKAEQMKYAIDNNIPDAHFERIFNMPKKDAQNLLNTGFGERPAVDREALRNRFRELDAQPQLTIPENPSINARQSWISHIDNLTTQQGVQPSHDFYQNLGHRTVPTSYDQMTDSEIEALRDHLFDRQMFTRRERIANENSMLSFDDDIDREFIDMTPLDRDGTPITNPYANEHINSQGNTVPQDLINSLRNSARNNFIRSGRSAGDKITKAEIKTRGKLENFIENATQNYPYYSGQVEEKVPSLFRSQEKSLNDVSRKVAKQTENIPSGTVYTGSLNTSHNSWLPQVKQIFNYKGGNPQFTGYKPMNSLGYLSKAQVPEEDIVKYLNTEMDELVKRGKLPTDIQRPFMHKGHPVLPQYAIKQKKNGGWLNKYK